jgi:hypothetical protein
VFSLYGFYFMILGVFEKFISERVSIVIGANTITANKVRILCVHKCSIRFQIPFPAVTFQGTIATIFYFDIFRYTYE